MNDTAVWELSISVKYICFLQKLMPVFFSFGDKQVVFAQKWTQT